MKNNLKILFKYIFAIFLSILVWNFIIGNYIYNESILDENSPAAGKIPFSKFVSGKEGYFKDKMGNYGFNNEYVETNSNKTRILMIGDSFTAATQIKRELNFSELLEDKLNSSASGTFDVINLGQGGRSMAEYLYYSDDYVNVFNGDFYIFQIKVGDFLNTDGSNRYYIDTDNNEFKIVKNDYDKITNAFLNIKSHSGWFEPIVGYSAIRLNMAASLNILPQKEKEQTDINPDREDYTEAIRWQLKELKKRYGKNILLLYTSTVPYIDNGQIITTAKRADQKEEFLNICREENINVINTSDKFIEYYNETGNMPFGFNNARIGNGHLNKYGHELFASIIYDYLIENKKVFNTD